MRLHVEQPHLGAEQLRHLAFRVLGAKLARETVRNILLRSRDEIAALEKEKRKPPRRIVVTQANKLWGFDLSLVWVLGFFPMWILGIVDYHGSRLVALEPVRWPTAACVVAVVERAFASQGLPARILSDRGSVFRGELFEKVLASRGVTHTMTRPCHPWTNGRIERVFRSFKETVRTSFWLLRSRAHVADVCSDFRAFYNGHRPHQAYGGRTPDEVHRGRPAASGHLGRISFLEGRMHWWRFS